MLAELTSAHRLLWVEERRDCGNGSHYQRPEARTLRTRLRSDPVTFEDEDLREALGLFTRLGCVFYANLTQALPEPETIC